MAFSCHICDKLFSTKCNLFRHVRNVHKVEIKQKTGSITCPACKEKFDALRIHIEHAHQVHIEFEEHVFENLEDFKTWKLRVEKQLSCSYTAKTTKLTASSGTKAFYWCHRSGYYEPAKDANRNPKGLITKKIDAHCPSTIIVTTTASGAINVDFWKTHFGHDDNIGHMFLTKEERKIIADKIQSGTSFQKILDKIRDSMHELERAHLVTRKDLHNISRDFKIDQTQKFHQSDPVSVDMWVELMNSSDMSPVIYYKQQGENDSENVLSKNDFMLCLMTEFQISMMQKFGTQKICIDSTHGLNPYNFQLTTILVVDDYGAGCPVAFCFSNRTDASALAIFIKSILKKCGVINTSVFMSDDAPALYNAWKEEMTSANHQLLCSWHVDRCWKANLKKINGGQEKKAFVYKALRVLMLEPDGDKFTALQQQFLLFLAEENEGDFLQYFEKTYAARSYLWALCYRKHLGINTNMYLESMHRKLKHLYLGGTVVRRLDVALNSLIKFSRDIVYEQLQNMQKSPQ